MGLIAALNDYIKRWSAHFSISGEFHTTGVGSGQLSDEIKTALYRITQEALNNVAKHAQASHVSVLIDLRPDRASIIVEDNGVGFEAEQLDGSHQRFGVIGMRERATLLGGTLDIESRPGHGTTIVVRIPLAPDLEGPP